MFRPGLNVWTLASAVGLLFIVVGAAHLYDERRFVGACTANGRDPETCTCVYASLSDLPEDERRLAIVWSNRSDFDGWIERGNSLMKNAEGTLSAEVVTHPAATFYGVVTSVSWLVRASTRFGAHVVLGWGALAGDAAVTVDSAMASNWANAQRVFANHGCQGFGENTVATYDNAKSAVGSWVNWAATHAGLK